MKNSNPNAYIRLGNLNTADFIQQADGSIRVASMEAVAGALIDSLTAATTTVDPTHSKLLLRIPYKDATGATVNGEVELGNLVHQFDVQGAYIGSMLELTVPNLA